MLHISIGYPIFHLSIILKAFHSPIFIFNHPHKIVLQDPHYPVLNLALTHSATVRRSLGKTTIPASSDLRLLRSAPICNHNFKGYKSSTHTAPEAKPIDGKVTFSADVPTDPELPTSSPTSRNFCRRSSLLEHTPSTSSGIRASA